MVKTVRIHDVGGPSVMRIEDLPIAPPGAGEALIRHRVIGVNFIDTYFRSGLYKTPGGLPFTPGAEAAGLVEAVGPDVTDLRPGDRVAYAGTIGAYAEARLIAADRLVPIPDGVSDESAAAALLKGMTAHYLLRRTFPVAPHHTVLFHAGAGGVGLIAGQWLKAIGAMSIATVGSADKAASAKAAGFDHVIDYSREDFVQRVGEITAGAKCDVVYDSVGRDTFPASLDCLKMRGTFVSFGNSSGPVPPFDLSLLSQKGSLHAVRPTLAHYTASRAELLQTAADLFKMMADGTIKVTIGQSFPLHDVVACHEALQSRKTIGSTLLKV